MARIRVIEPHFLPAHRHLARVPADLLFDAEPVAAGDGRGSRIPHELFANAS